MKSLLIANNLPYPIDKGEKIRTMTILESLVKISDVDLVTVSKDKNISDSVNFLNNFCKNIHVFNLNRIKSFFQMIIGFLLGKSLTHSNFYSCDMNKYLKELDYKKYDFIFIISGNIYLNIPPKISKKVLWDLIDLDSNKWNFLSKRTDNYLIKYLYNREAKILAKIEKNISENAVCFVVNQREVDIYSSSNQKIDCKILPVVIPENSEKALNIAREEKLLVFSGNMDYQPNIDSVIVLHDFIFPLIKILDPEVKVLIVGRSPSKFLQKKCYKFKFTGEVENASEHIKKASVYLGFFEYFFGTPSKILNAINCKIPIVTNKEVASIFNLENERDVLIASNYDEFARQVMRLLDDRGLSEKLVNNSLVKINSFSSKLLSNEIIKYLTEIK